MEFSTHIHESVLEFGTDMHETTTMNHADFGNPLTFHVAHPAGQGFPSLSSEILHLLGQRSPGFSPEGSHL